MNPQIAFTAQEIARLGELRAALAEHRKLQAEARIATEHLQTLSKSLPQARETLRNFLPSQLVDFGPHVQSVVNEIQRHEIIESALRDSSEQVGRQSASLSRKIIRDAVQIEQLLPAKIRNSFPDPRDAADVVETTMGLVSKACARGFEVLNSLQGKTEIERAETLLKICRDCGADVPEVAL